MKYGQISGIEQPVSRIFLGTASAPFATGEDGSELLEGALVLGRVMGDHTAFAESIELLPKLLMP